MASTDLASIHPPSPIRAGMMLDRYKLVCKLADGGMASVWIARQQGKHGFEKLVAVKTILPTFVDENPLREMFLDEARIAARIDHPNVARILDLGEEGQVLYLVMEWVEGESLAKLHRLVAQAKVEFPTATYLRIVADACGGLHAAHELRDVDGTPLEVVHRDVSPQNILVSTDGQAKVIDFGIARSRGRVAEETTFGIVKGKLHYMPPEQARGEHVDRTADVWALGAMLYHFFAGRPVHSDANEVAVMTKLVSRAAIDPSPEKVPQAIQDVIMRALAFKPKDRFSTIAELRAAIEEAMAATGLGATTAEAAKFVEEMAGSRVAARRDRVREAIRALEEGGSVAYHASDVSNPSLLMLSAAGTGQKEASQSHTRRKSEPVTPSDGRTMLQRPASRAPIPGALALLAIGAGVFFIKNRHRPDAVGVATASTVSPSSATATEPPAASVATENAPSGSIAIATTARGAPGGAPDRRPWVAPKFPATPARAGVPTPAPVPAAPSDVAATAATPVASPPPPAATPSESAPPPVVAPPPPIAAPAPAPPPVAAPAPAPAVDPKRGRVRVAGVQNEHGVRKRDVQAALGRTTGAMTECYRAELARTPSGPTGPGTLRIETDGEGRITKASAAVGFSPTVARCIERAVSGTSVADVDTGDALADVLLTFDLE